GGNPHAELLGDAVENPLVDFAGRRLDGDLVADAAQERVVDQVLGIEIGGKDGELLKRNFKLLTVGQSQKVVSAFQRHDPAVEKLLGAAQLSAEVINQEDAAIRFHMQRRLIKVGLGVEAQVEHFQIQLAAGNDHRSLGLYPWS